MSLTRNDEGPVLADVDFAAIKRIATAERAEAIKAIGRVIRSWIRSGIKLRHFGDVFTHPAGQPNVQLLMRWG